MYLRINFLTFRQTYEEFSRKNVNTRCYFKLMTIKYYSEAEQKQKIENGNPTLILDHPCHINDGIIAFEDYEFKQFIEIFEARIKNRDLQYFVPASGSGSRMFQFLFEFLNNPNDENRSKAERFINRVKDFAFYFKIPVDIRKKFEADEIELAEFIEFILFDVKLDFANSPKGLIPFHKTGDFILNPFQVQILQGMKTGGEECVFNFSIQDRFKERIQSSIDTLQTMIGKEPILSFSEQDKKTDSFAFADDLTVAKDENGNQIMRPSGHGALLANLNKIEADLLIIKNIDNVQHISKSNKSINTFKFLSGIVIYAQDKIFSSIRALNDGNRDFAIEMIEELNDEFQLYHRSIDISNMSNDELIDMLNRPTRVCGMVVNEGQPGGGPYWVKNADGSISKQIVEKAQISKDKEQYHKMLKATHHNPVEIVCGLKDFEGNKFDLSDFSNEDLYFIVEKDQKGQKIKYLERPGLWNGSMDNWNTIFVEVDAKTFSPVKTILDLLEKAHRSD